MERPCAWKKYTPQQVEELEELCRGYKQFLSENKTERLCVKTGIKMAEEAGYVDLETVIAEGRELKAGDKVYAANHGKDLMLVNLGTAPLEQGFNILGAHVDSPRLDLKQNPAFEAGDMAYLDTHYYGGVKSYHWVASPLALVGVICKKDGTTVDINIGDKADDPVFTISDLLIHLSSEQMSKPAKDAVDAEILDVIVGGRPVKFDGDDKDAPKEPVKQMFLDILKEQYDVEEEDFLSAEIEVVPAGPARDMGLDRSMILGYGHDDRVCAYPSMLAQIDVANVERTSITLIVDKEEIGSVGATGMTSRFFENTVAEIMTLAGEDSPLALRRALARSRMLSSDVSAGFDPAMPASSRPRTRPLWVAACALTSTRQPRQGRLQRRRCRVRGPRPRHHGRGPAWTSRPVSSVASTRAAAAPCLHHGQVWHERHRLRRCPSCPCTPCGRSPTRPISTRPIAGTKPSSSAPNQPFISCGEIRTKLAHKQPKQTVFHRTFWQRRAHAAGHHFARQADARGPRCF